MRGEIVFCGGIERYFGFTPEMGEMCPACYTKRGDPCFFCVGSGQVGWRNQDPCPCGCRQRREETNDEPET